MPFKDQKPEVRLQAAQHLAGLSGSTEGEKASRSGWENIDAALARLIGDLAPVSQQALSTLINLSNETAIVEHMTNSSSLFDKVMENLKSYHEKLGATKVTNRAKCTRNQKPATLKFNFAVEYIANI